MSFQEASRAMTHQRIMTCVIRFGTILSLACFALAAGDAKNLAARQAASSAAASFSGESPSLAARDDGPREVLEQIVELLKAGQAEEASQLMTEQAIDTVFGEPLFRACMLTSDRIKIPGQTEEYDAALKKFTQTFGLADYKLPNWFFEGGLSELSNPSSPRMRAIYQEIYSAIEAAGKSRWDAYNAAQKVHAIGLGDIPNPLFAPYVSHELDGDHSLVGVEIELPEVEGQRLKANNYFDFVKLDGKWRFAGINREESQAAIRDALATLEQFRIKTLENPEFAGEALDGSKVDLAAMRGKVVLIDFWGTWCGPCIAEFPALRLIYDAFHPHGLEVIGIAVDERETLKEFFTKVEPLPWANIADKDGEFAEKYSIKSFPTVLIIDQEGKHVASNLFGKKLVDELIARLKLNPADFEGLKADLRKLHATPPPDSGFKRVTVPQTTVERSDK